MENNETRINKLIDIINNAITGDYSGRISIDSKDLLGMLSQKINDVMLTLERLTQNLQVISEGNVSQYVKGEMGLAAVIKTLQADLRHFIWQAKAVADGDLSQKVLYLGELGNAFNKMTESLKKSREEIESYSKKLEEKVMERTEELHTSLREKEILLNEWRKTFDSSQDLIMVIDNEFKIVRANLAVANFLRKPTNQILGEYCYELFHRTKRPPDICPLMRAKRTKKHEELELYLSERGIWISATVDPILDVKGNITETIHVIKDITERKRAEEALRKAHDELERRVQERTAELAKVNEELRIEITERKKMGEQIQTSLKEKEILLKEIHHRVKNNMQVVSSLLSLQARYIKDKRALDVFNESQNRIRAMALVHERLYRSEGLVYIDFGEYIRYLTSNLLQSYQVSSEAITLKVNADGVSLNIDTAIPCGLIINELVSNSLKHAFPEGQTGEICIDLSSDDNKFTLIVSDNGVGFPKDLDFKNTESLGLQLVNTLTGQINGTMELDTCPPSQLVGGRRASGGTAFKITFSP